MSIFDKIKQGQLPSDETILKLLDDPFIDKDNQEEIKKYISILTNSLQSAQLTQEQLMIAKVLFVLETLVGDEHAVYNFIDRAFRLYMHEVDLDFIEFLNTFLVKVGPHRLFDILNQQISTLHTLPKKQMRSFFNWVLHEVWSLKEYHNNSKFKMLYPNLQQLLYQLRDSGRIDDMMYVEFFTYHIMGNSFHTIDEWREFNQTITQETIKAYKNIIPQLPKPNPKKKDKKRIAFVKDRIVFNSPFMVEYSLFRNLLSNEEFRKNYEIIVYSFNQFEKSDDDENCILDLQDIGVRVKSPVSYFKQDGYYNNHLDKALTLRQVMIDDDIDIMLAGGVFPILNFLYVSRVAPLQIYYSHGNCAYDVPNIDKRISHFEQECKEFEWNVINVPLAREFLVGNEGEKIVADIIKQDYKQQFGEDVVILGTIGRLIKLDSDEYIQTIAKIMKENPNTIYLACGSGNEDNIREKIKKYGIDEERFIFTGHVKPHVYGWVIDVWINTYPLRQGHSQEEYLAKQHGWAVEGEFLIDCKEKNDYERIYNNFLKDRAEFFYEVFEVTPDDIDENVSYDRLRFNVYKKHNKDINEESILKCIEHVEEAKDCKDKWFRIVDCAIKNKDYYDMHRWVLNRLRDVKQKYQQKDIEKFLSILEV
ncbi:MAG: hypothetical protein GXO40_02080 [Epsilonproteobacteria bacterium]|nr:hypothetical protein [Campylobacterota bacterium]